MKLINILFISIILFSCSLTKGVTEKTPNENNVSILNDSVKAWENLDKIPIGFEVLHSPSRVKKFTAQMDGWPFKWHFKTTVKNISNKDISIFSFGIFAWDNGKWIIDENQKKYNSGFIDSNIFSEWYNCPNGLIKSNQSFSDSENWAGNYHFESFKQKWVYLGKDKEGNIYKGESIVRLEK